MGSKILKIATPDVNIDKDTGHCPYLPCLDRLMHYLEAELIIQTLIPQLILLLSSNKLRMSQLIESVWISREWE